MNRLLLALFLSLVSTASDAWLEAPPNPDTATVYNNVSYDATGINGVNGTHTSECCALAIVPQTYNNIIIVAHGGSGDSVDECRQTEICTLSTVPYTITNATWSSTYGGVCTFTLTTDPTVGTYGPVLSRGQPFTVSGVASTGGSGFNGAWTTTSVDGPDKQVTTSCTILNAGTYVSGGTGTAITVTPSSLIYVYLNYMKAVLIFPQAWQPLGGTDAGNTALFTGTLDANTLTVDSAPTSGIIALSEILTGTGITGTQTITGNSNTPGPTMGYSGTWTVSPGISGSTGSISISANGAPVARNTTAWGNREMSSSRDDITGIDDLAKGAAAAWSINAKLVSLVGHSEGSMLSNVERWEHPSDFGTFGAWSGPTPWYYFSPGGGHTTTPSPLRPMQVFQGGRDTTICDYPAGDPNCYGTANALHGGISDNILTIDSVDSGSVTPGNVLIADGTALVHGTQIIDEIDSAHYHVYPGGQSVSDGTAMTTDNVMSANIGDNSNNPTTAHLAYPQFTTWPSFSVSVAEWAQAYCSYGHSQLQASDFTQTAATTGYLLTADPCAGVEYNVITDGDHTMRLMQTSLGGWPLLIRFYLFAAAHHP